MLDDPYVLGELARIQLAELRLAAARHEQISAALRARRSAREALGRALIRIGTRLIAASPDPSACRS